MFKPPMESLAVRKAKVSQALAAIDKPFVVVVDDIDRLTAPEVRDIFKLVRLTANFPNVIYILAFDRCRVEKALSEEGISGRDYLEKILQVAIDIPAMPVQVLTTEIVRAINEVLSQIPDAGTFDQNRGPDVLMEIVRPVLGNMRDVRRYAAAIYGTVRSLDGQIALVDVLGLEAVRIFLPDVFSRMHGALDALTTTSDPDPYGGRQAVERLKKPIDELVEAAGTNGEVVRALITRLFPAAQRHVGGTHYGSDWKGQWLRERRVAHEDVFRLYLERVVGRGLKAFGDAEQAWRRMPNLTEFDRYLHSLSPDGLRDVIASLELYEDEFGPAQVTPGVIVLLNLLPDLPDTPAGTLELGSRFIVGRVVYRLIRSLKDPAAVEKAVEAVLPQISTLSSKLELIHTIGYREGIGHKLVSEASASAFERRWRFEVRGARLRDLIDEKDLLWMLLQVKRQAEQDEPRVEIADAPDMTLALLRSACTEVRAQTIGDRAVRRSVRLEWNALIELYGDEAVLHERVAKLRDRSPSEADSELLGLVEKYIGGWRPRDFSG